MKLHRNLSLLVVGLSLIAVCLASKFDVDEDSDGSDGIGGSFGPVKRQLQQQQQSVKGLGGLGGIQIKQRQQQQQQQSVQGLGVLGSLGNLGGIQIKQQQAPQQSVNGGGGQSNQISLGNLADGIGGLWKGAQDSFNQGISNFQGGLSDYGFGKASSSSGSGGSGSGGSGIPGDVQEGQTRDIFGSLETVAEWSMLLFKPAELVKAIADYFQLDLDIFTNKIGDGLVFGAEAMMSPFVSSIKIIEKIFVPNACRLRLFCDLGSNLRFMSGIASRFSQAFLGSSLTFKAFSEGVLGSDCDLVYVSCDPQLRLGFIPGARSIQSVGPNTQAVTTNETKKVS